MAEQALQHRLRSQAWKAHKRTPDQALQDSPSPWKKPHTNPVEGPSPRSLSFTTADAHKVDYEAEKTAHQDRRDSEASSFMTNPELWMTRECKAANDTMPAKYAEYEPAEGDLGEQNASQIDISAPAPAAVVAAAPAAGPPPPVAASPAAAAPLQPPPPPPPGPPGTVYDKNGLDWVDGMCFSRERQSPVNFDDHIKDPPSDILRRP